MCVRVLFPIPSFFEFPGGGGGGGGGEWFVGILFPIPSTFEYPGGGGRGCLEPNICRHSILLLLAGGHKVDES